MPTSRIVVGMSGGVDSSVAAYLLKQQGHDLLGVFMRNWEEDNDRHCPARQDFLDVLAVADVIGLEVDAVNFSAEYRDRVFAYFLTELQAGRTPNPDVLCNAEIKFKAFLDFALAQGAEKIATGHYARLDVRDGLTRLLKAVDQTKDQSYFLYRLSQHQVSNALFPLGEMLKTEVRRIAHEIHLPNAAKKDSTGICFIGERPFRAFLEQYLPKEPGVMQTPEGRVVGEHQGLMYYTLGQRQGLGIGGQKDSNDEPWFVAAKEMATNTLVVVQGHDHPLLLSRTLTATQLSWISGHAPEAGKPCAAKTRYRQNDAPCHVQTLNDDTLTLEFESPQWAVTPGQSVVLYDGDICLGGGIIN
ncbi:MAG: tRNA 2-thiouridine(34) synthase MnmA [Thiobacillaceae bacterium]